MEKPEGYDEAQEAGEREQLELGGHICVIKQATAGETSTLKQQLILLLDIAEGPQKDFYQNQFKSDPRVDKKWGCVYRQITVGNSIPFFKGLVSAIEKSNAGYTWNWDEKTLKGKLIGGVFGREEYEGADGKNHWFTKCQSIRSVEAIRKGVPIPEDKPLSGSAKSSYGRKDDFVEISGDDLPF